jgi:hypothetical protein
VAESVSLMAGLVYVVCGGHLVAIDPPRRLYCKTGPAGSWPRVIYAPGSKETYCTGKRDLESSKSGLLLLGMPEVRTSVARDLSCSLQRPQKGQPQRTSVMQKLPHVCPNRTFWHLYHLFVGRSRDQCRCKIDVMMK